MFKNNVVAFALALLMVGGSVRPAAQAENAEVSAVRKNLAKVFHVAALTSVLPAHMFLGQLNQATKGAKLLEKSKKDQAKALMVFMAPTMLEVISNILAKNNCSEQFFNISKILAVQSSLVLMEHAKVGEWAKSFAKLGNEEPAKKTK